MKVDRKDPFRFMSVFLLGDMFLSVPCNKMREEFRMSMGVFKSFSCEGDRRNFRLTTWEAGNHGKFDIICHTQVTMVPTSNYWLVSWPCLFLMVRTRRVCCQKSSSSLR